MKRLTYDDKGCWTVVGTRGLLCEETCQEQQDCVGCPIAAAINKLAEYENAIEAGNLVWMGECE